RISSRCSSRKPRCAGSCAARTGAISWPSSNMTTKRMDSSVGGLMARRDSVACFNHSLDLGGLLEMIQPVGLNPPGGGLHQKRRVVVLVGKERVERDADRFTL